MISSVVCTSINKNFYLYDDCHKLSMLIHPELAKFHDISSININSYYERKYAYLKKYGFFAKYENVNIATTVDESLIQNGINQTRQIVYEVTGSCNLKCSYCVLGDFYESFDERNGKNIDINNAIKILKYILELKRRNNETRLTISFYGGEPLLNINFIKQIVNTVNELNSKKEMDIDFMMTTNATLIHDYVPFLVENNFSLLISLDGNEENDSYRLFRKNGKGSFQTVIDNMDMIQKEYPDYFDNNIDFNAVLHNRNSVKDIYEFIYGRYKKNPRIAELMIDYINHNKKDIFGKMFHSKKNSETEFYEEHPELLDKMHNESLLFGELIDFIKYYSVNSYVSNATSLLKDEEIYFPTNTCIPFSKKIFVTNQNKLLPCEKISHKYSMGEINENVIINTSEIARQFSSYYEHMQKVCQYCYVHRFCGMCMYRLRNLDSSDGNKIACYNFHDEKKFQIKLSRIFSFIEKYPNDLFQVLEDVIITI